MILLSIGTDLLSRLMAGDTEGPDTAWLLFGPDFDAAERAEEDEPLPLAAE